MPKTLSQTVLDCVDRAIAEFLYGRWEEVSYDVAFQAFPDDEGRFFGQIAIYLQISGPNKGTHVFAMPILRPHDLTEQLVVDVVKQALADMFAERERNKTQTPET